MQKEDVASLETFFKRTQDALKKHSVECWLIYVKKEMKSWIYKTLNLEDAYISRPAFFLFFPNKDPVVLYSELDTSAMGRLHNIPIQKKTYFTYVEQRSSLLELLKGIKTLSLDYIEDGSLPSLSTIDAGMKNWLLQNGFQGISSSIFSDEILAKVTKEGLASHLKAAKALEEILEMAFSFLAENASKKEIYEMNVHDLICNWMKEKGLIVSSPIVAFGKNSSDPHYECKDHGKKLEKGDVILIDLWSKEAKPNSIYADFTQVGYLQGQSIPPEVMEVFSCVQNAQKKAIEELTKRLPKQKVTGKEADQFARSYIEEKGYGPFFRHRTGHNVGAECHGLGVNLDSIEFPDPRIFPTEAIFTVEPGIYLPGKFGIRLECDLYIDQNYEVKVTGGLQKVLRILKV